MTDPRRLLDGAGTDLECNLLAADNTEMPDARAKQRAALALAIGTASVWPIAATTTKASKLGQSILVKLVAVGAVGAAVWSAAHYLHSRSGSNAPVAAHAVSAPVRAPEPPITNDPAANGNSGAAAPAVTPTPLDSLERERPVESPRRASGAAPSAASSAAQGGSIADEIRMLDAARRAEAGGDSAGAIRALDDYKRQFPRGAFSEESTLLRIEALARLGNRSAARALAQKFRAAHPDSPHLRRIDSILAEP